MTAAAASILALLASGTAWSQASRSSIPAENEASARQAAVDNAARPLLEAARARPYLGGYWRIAQPITALTTAEGKAPPLNAAGRKALRQVAAERKAGRNPDPMDVCLPPGTPRSLIVDKPFMIAHAAAKITFFHQVYHVIRHVYLDGPLQIADKDREELWEGTSSGRWEGDTLVIETANFNGNQWLDDSGLPQSKDMRVTERIRRPDASTLENLVTYEDPVYYSKPWTARLQFRALPRSTLLVEEDCAEKLLEFPMKAYAPE
ncbi:MAG TPA: hypothetical protein VKO83_00425 [Steroidobacteraceae bacterium]|nr:hypothetical protein [Steroidobacteraceae bacterium]